MDRETRIKLLIDEAGMPQDLAERAVDSDDADIQRQIDAIIEARASREEALERLGRRADRILAAS